MFKWIRRMVKNAILAGVSDAVAELEHGTEGLDEAPRLLEARIADVMAEEADDEPVPAGNGRNKGRRK